MYVDLDVDFKEMLNGIRNELFLGAVLFVTNSEETCV